MKRGIEEKDEPGQCLSNEILREIGAIIRSIYCVDLKFFFRWHSTCRSIYKEYKQISPENLLAMMRMKKKHQEKLLYHDACSFNHKNNRLLKDMIRVLCLYEAVNWRLEEAVSCEIQKVENDRSRFIDSIGYIDDWTVYVQKERRIKDTSYFLFLLKQVAYHIEERYGWIMCLVVEGNYNITEIIQMVDWSTIEGSIDQLRIVIGHPTLILNLTSTSNWDVFVQGIKHILCASLLKYKQGNIY